MRAKRVRVLVVDDNPDHAQIMVHHLKRAARALGVTVAVVVAATSAQAMTEAGRGGLTMVITDYRLPGECTGMDIRDALQRQLDIPVHVVSGHRPGKASMRTVSVVDKTEAETRVEDWLRQATEPPPGWFARTFTPTPRRRDRPSRSSRRASLISSAT